MKAKFMEKIIDVVVIIKSIILKITAGVFLNYLKKGLVAFWVKDMSVHFFFGV